MHFSVESSTGSELRYSVRKDEIVVGASSSADVVVRAPGVAPRHLVIQRNGDVCTFVVERRQNVVLNGQRRTRGVLHVGDRLRVGTATIVFQGTEDDEEMLDGLEVEDQARSAERGVEGAAPDAAVAAGGDVRRGGKVLVFQESERLSEARGRIVELFGSSLRADIVPVLQGFFRDVLPDREVMLTWIDEDRRLQPIVSNWASDIPRIPAKTFEELAAGHRYAVLRGGERDLFIYPVAGEGARPVAYLLVGGAEPLDDAEELITAETAAMLAVHWRRVEDSNLLHSRWKESAEAALVDSFPGTSNAVRVLRDNILAAARGEGAVVVAGRPGSGRTYVARTIANLHPTGVLPVVVFQARRDDTERLRSELFGDPATETIGLCDQLHGGVLVIRDVHELPLPLQRELGAVIRGEGDRRVSRRLRWVLTTGENVLALVKQGQLDSTLFSAAQANLVAVPSLSERREDLPLLIVRLLDGVAREQEKGVRGLELDTLNGLLSHGWDGEMVELLAELRRLVSATPDGEMVRGEIPADVQQTASEGDGRGSVEYLLGESDDLKELVPAVERLVIDRVLRRVLGNQSKAARTLNISRGALIAKSKEYDIPDYRYLRRQKS